MFVGNQLLILRNNLRNSGLGEAEKWGRASCWELLCCQRPLEGQKTLSHPLSGVAAGRPQAGAAPQLCQLCCCRNSFTPVAPLRVLNQQPQRFPEKLQALQTASASSKRPLCHPKSPLPRQKWTEIQCRSSPGLREGTQPGRSSVPYPKSNNEPSMFSQNPPPAR